MAAHLMVGAAASLLTTPHFEATGSNGERPAEERESIPVDLLPSAEAAPEPPLPPAAVETAPAPAHAHRITAAPVVAPPSAPPREEELVDIDEVEAGGDEAAPAPSYRTLGVTAAVRDHGAAQGPGEQPPAISAAEAAYLRTYETFPNLPAALWVTGRSYAVTAQVCVSREGRVSGVVIKDGGVSDLENVITASVRSWRYEPRLVEGQPRPFCHLIRFVYSVKR
jgi:protein TonB